MAHEVFVSYSSKDKAIADAVVASMESNGIRCWYAPRDIRSGDDWGKAITSAIEGSKLFLLIFSGHANQSQRVLDELNLGISCETTIIPFRIENLEPDGAMRLHLTSRHWLDAFDHSWERNLQKLIHTVSATLDISLGAEDIQLPEAGRREKAGLENKLLQRIVIGVFIAAVVIAGGWYGLTKLDLLGNTSPAAEQEDPPASGSDDLPVDWTTPELVVPGDNLWLEEEGTYTAVGTKDTIVWTREKYAGDVEISLDIESPYSFAGASIIVYGNGMSLSPGCLIFTAASDMLAIWKDTIYEEGKFLYDSAASLNFMGEKHTLLVTIIDRKAALYVDGELISSVFLNEDIKDYGRIGFLKYWEFDEITYSNIRIKGSVTTQ